jgi:hypothetical protein
LGSAATSIRDSVDEELNMRRVDIHFFMVDFSDMHFSYLVGQHRLYEDKNTLWRAFNFG